MKLFILFIILHSINTKAEIIALGDTNNQENFKKYLIKNSNLKSLTNFLIESQIKENDRIIYEKNTLAVKGLLLRDLTPSIFLFKELSTFYEKNMIISEKSSKIISRSFYRLSNLERNHADYWVKTAVLYNPFHTPSKAIFNPQIIELYQRTHSQNFPYFSKKFKDSILPNGGSLYLNGRLVTNSLLIHPSQSYHLKVFKNGYHPKTLILTGIKLNSLKNIKLNKLNLGSCKKPIFKKHNGIKIDQIYFNKNCIINQNIPKTKSYQKIKSFKPLNHQILTKKTKSPKHNTISLFKKRSTWYVIGAIVGSAIIYSAVKDSQKPPSITPVFHD